MAGYSRIYTIKIIESENMVNMKNEVLHVYYHVSKFHNIPMNRNEVMQFTLQTIHCKTDRHSTLVFHILQYEKDNILT